MTQFHVGDRIKCISSFITLMAQTINKLTKNKIYKILRIDICDSFYYSIWFIHDDGKLDWCSGDFILNNFIKVKSDYLKIKIRKLKKLLTR